jgi:putative membrane protein
MILLHGGDPLLPHHLWTAWTLHAPVVAGLVLAAAAYVAGRRRAARRAGDTRRGALFWSALLALVVGLLSPLDALAGALASAHMVQHLLITLVAAPLLVLSAPSRSLMRGLPVSVRRQANRWRRQLRVTRSHTDVLHDPVVAWLLYVVTLWFWHGAVPYDAALRHDSVHALSHATYLLTGLVFWRVVAETGHVKGRSPGLGVLLVFATAMQSVFLSALLTFANTSWYDGYADTTRRWGLEPLADQQLAGVIMWIPGGVVYLGTALVLLVSWIRADGSEMTSAKPRPVPSMGGAEDRGRCRDPRW